MADPRPRSRHALTAAAILIIGPMISAPALAQFDDITWVLGPDVARVGQLARLQIPENYRFTSAEGTQDLMRMMGNLVSGGELGFVAPDAEDQDWFVVFEFDEVGYVKDDDRDDLDADGMMKAMQAGNKESNKRRKEMGMPTLELVGWEREPHYDSSTNNLEWGTRLKSDEGPVVNYYTRYLGRHGVMEVALVCAPEDLDASLVPFRELMTGYEFTDGNRYAEFRSGDKIAQYGLAALVTGGAAAVALKTGLLQKMWKFLVLGLVAIGAFIKRILGRGGD